MNKKAQEFCLEVEKLSKKYNLPFFFLTDGASMTRNKDCEAIAVARQMHMKWEEEHNIDSQEDWLK